MLLQELYRRLSVGHFSNLALGNDGDGTLSAKGKVATIVHANAALQTLAKRFVLKEDFLVLQLEEGRFLYNMRPEFAVSTQIAQGGNGPFYIEDTEEEPFTGGFIKALRIYTESGTELPLNEADNPLSVFTPTSKQIQVTGSIQSDRLGISYKTFLPEIPADSDDDYEIDLPEALETPLQLYIAAQVYSAMNGQEHLLRAQTLLQTYEQDLAVIAQEDLLSSSSITHQNKFETRGFA